jgi:hypothetical protein
MRKTRPAAQFFRQRSSSYSVELTAKTTLLVWTNVDRLVGRGAGELIRPLIVSGMETIPAASGASRSAGQQRLRAPVARTG